MIKLRNKILPLLILSLGLGGCSTVGAFAVDDSQTAIAIALATPATAADAPCFMAWGAIAQAISPAVPGGPAPKVGIMALVELKRAGKMTLSSPACLPITAEIAMQLLRIAGGPGGGLLP
jgi:hypothetical protein